METNEWYEHSFGADYLIVYKHRDMEGAAREVARMMGWMQPPAGARILDICCGMGRHALTLADLGYDVSGIDLSEVLLEQARLLDGTARVAWQKADMRELPFATASFDATVNFFTSFGYFSEDAENRLALLEMARVLRPGGQFLIDFLNPPQIIAKLVPETVRTEGDLHIVEQRKVVDGFVCKSIAVGPPNGPIRRYEERVKLYELADFQRLMAGTSLCIERVSGDYDGSPYDRDRSPRLILSGRKAGA